MEDDYETMTSPTPDDDMQYDIPRTSHQPLPSIPHLVAPLTVSNVGVAEDADGLYESIYSSVICDIMRQS